MSLLSILVADKIRRKRLAGASAQLPGLLGGAVTTQGSMRGTETFDEFGNPIFGEPTLDTRREGYGFLGSDQGPGAQMDLLGGMIGAGYNPTEVSTMMQPLYNQQKQQQALQQQAMKQISPKEQLAMESSMMDRFQKQITVPRTSMKVYNQAANLYKKADFMDGALSGADSIAMAKMYLKQILPNESVMSTDVGDLKFSQGVPEYISSWLSNLFGSGSMSKEAAQELIMTMNKNANFEDQYRNEVRQQFGNQAERYGVSDEFMGSPYSISPLPFDQGPDTPANNPQSNLTPQQQSRRAYLEELEKKEIMETFPDKWK